MRSLLAASSLAPRLPQPPAPGRPPPLSTERDPPAPGPQAPRLPAARARPRWGLWVPSTALCVSPSLWSGVGWGPTLRPRPHRSSRSGALHTHVLHTLRMPGEMASQAGPGGHRALRSALTPGRGQASVPELKSLRPELRAPLGGPDVPQEPPGLISPCATPCPARAPRPAQPSPLWGDLTPRRARACTRALRQLPPLGLGALWADLALPRRPELLLLPAPGRPPAGAGPHRRASADIRPQNVPTPR